MELCGPQVGGPGLDIGAGMERGFTLCEGARRIRGEAAGDTDLGKDAGAGGAVSDSHVAIVIDGQTGNPAIDAIGAAPKKVPYCAGAARRWRHR